MDEHAAFGRLVDALRPWLDQVVIVGGWAHRLHRHTQLAVAPAYEPVQTLDADVAMARRAKPQSKERTMEKLKLELDSLCVESFAAGEAADRGSVHAAEATPGQSCYRTACCPDTAQPTCTL